MNGVDLGADQGRAAAYADPVEKDRLVATGPDIQHKGVRAAGCMSHQGVSKRLEKARRVDLELDDHGRSPGVRDRTGVATTAQCDRAQDLGALGCSDDNSD